MVVLERMKIDIKQKRLQCTFPKLTEPNQEYILGIAEGLKYAQSNRPKEQSSDTNTVDFFDNPPNRRGIS